MNWKIVFVILPIYLIFSAISIFFLLIFISDVLFLIIYIIFIVSFSSGLLLLGIFESKDYAEDIKALTDVEKVEIIVDDDNGVKLAGKVYRHVLETIDTPMGKRYPEKRPLVIFFHGFYGKKEESEIYIIPLARLGYIGFTFDARGHGESGGSKNDYNEILKDSKRVLDLVSSISDVKENSICCIGISMGATSVLTECYIDDRVATVVGISAMHNVDAILELKFRPLTIGWFLKRSFKRMRDREKENKSAPFYYLKDDPKLNEDRLFMVHAENDMLFPPKATFKLNKEQANIPDDQTLLLERGGHGLEGRETLLLASFIKWMHKNKSMRI
jgi:esterase/lipase